MIRRGGAGAFEADDGYTYGRTADAKPRAPAADDTPRAVLGTDLGFSRNSTAGAVAVPRGACVELVAWREWRPGREPLRPSVTLAELAAFGRTHGAGLAIGDGHYRESAREVFAPAGIMFSNAPAVPWVAFGAVQRLLQEGRVRGLDCPGEIIGARSTDEHVGLVRAQLERVRGERIDGGAMRVVLPQSKDGRHCDVAAAVVLALWGAARRIGKGYAAPLGAPLPR